MTAISDRLRNGAWVQQTPTHSGVGGHFMPAWTIDFIPLTASNTAMGALQHTTTATALTLAAGTGITSVTRPDGTVVLQLDNGGFMLGNAAEPVGRGITLTSSANMSGTNFTLTALDQYGAKFTSKLAGPNTNTVTFPKAAYQVISIVPDATDGTNNVSVGYGDTFGFRYRCDSAAYVQARVGALALDTGTFTVADTTSPATNATGDVRGTYKLNTASNGAKVVSIVVRYTDPQLHAIKLNDPLLFGVAQV